MDFPARTCKHLSNERPDLESARYWIDPNGGDKADAVQVYCDMTEKATCIQPSFGESNTDIADNENELRLSRTANGMVSYDIPTNQLNSLQMMSTHASQSMKYYCNNPNDYNWVSNPQIALTFLAWDGAKLTAKGSKHLRYELIEDGCQVNLEF